MSIDLEDITNRQRLRRINPTHECPDQEAVDADIQALIESLEQAREEAAYLTANDEDLRASAEIWCRLYDASQARANAAAHELDQVRAELPANVKTLYSVLDRVQSLTAALGAAVQDCTICARSACDAAAIARQTRDECVRCARALDALKSRLS